MISIKSSVSLTQPHTHERTHSHWTDCVEYGYRSLLCSPQFMKTFYFNSYFIRSATWSCQHTAAVDASAAAAAASRVEYFIWLGFIFGMSVQVRCSVTAHARFARRIWFQSEQIWLPSRSICRKSKTNISFFFSLGLVYEQQINSANFIRF